MFSLEFYKLFTKWHQYCSIHRTEMPHLQKIANIRRNNGVHLQEFHNFYKPIRYLGNGFSDGSLKLSPERLHLRKNQFVMVSVSGPEKSQNMFRKRIIEAIRRAQEEIVIAHFYFHPPEDIMEALKDANTKRGVNIRVFTNQSNHISPRSHFVFAPRSMYHVRELGGYKINPNLELYHWNSERSSFHQKCIVIDRKLTVIGSSNFGHKSFTSMSDYEMDVSVRSTEIAKDAINDLESDIKANNFVKVLPEEVAQYPGFTEVLKTVVHVAGSDKWG